MSTHYQHHRVHASYSFRAMLVASDKEPDLHIPPQVARELVSALNSARATFALLRSHLKRIPRLTQHHEDPPDLSMLRSKLKAIREFVGDSPHAWEVTCTPRQVQEAQRKRPPPTPKKVDG